MTSLISNNWPWLSEEACTKRVHVIVEIKYLRTDCCPVQSVICYDMKYFMKTS